MLGQRSAVEIHPWFGTAKRVVMDSAGYQFLAAAALTSNQYGCIGLRNFDHQLHQLLHGLACDDRGETKIGLRPRRLPFTFGPTCAGERRNLLVRLDASHSHAASSETVRFRVWNRMPGNALD